MQNSTYLGLVPFPKGSYSVVAGPTKDRYTDKRLCFCSPVSRSSLLMASGTLLAIGGEPSRMPALTYKVSADISSARAICCKMSADGRRMPRSICERYGFDTPADRARSRMLFCAFSRCWRINSPTSCKVSVGRIGMALRIFHHCTGATFAHTRY